MKRHIHILGPMLIGGVIWSLSTGCSSNPVSSDIGTFEYDCFTIYPDSLTWPNGALTVTENSLHDHILDTWLILQSFSGETNDADNGIDADEHIAALRREIRNGTIARDYFWPMKDRSARWIIEAYQMYRVGRNRQWLDEAYVIGAKAIDQLWETNLIQEIGLLRGEAEIAGFNEPVYPQWMRMSDKLCTIHLSTNAITVTALRALSAMADSLGIDAPQFDQRADLLIKSINRHLWSPATGTYAQCLYSAPYPIPCNTPDIPALLLTVSSGSACPEVTRYMFTQLIKNKSDFIKPAQLPPTVKWQTSTTADISNTDINTSLSVYENGRCEQELRNGATKLTLTQPDRFTIVNVVTETDGLTGFSARPHKIIPYGSIIEIEAEQIGTPGTKLIKQRSMAKRFIELTPTKNSRVSFTVDQPTDSKYIIELIYTDGTSYQPWQLRDIIVNGHLSGIAAMPKLYTGPSTRGTSTPVLINLSAGTNYIVIDVTPLLLPRGSILLDKIKLTRL